LLCHAGGGALFYQVDHRRSRTSDVGDDVQHGAV
jgi:hypothetical protein